MKKEEAKGFTQEEINQLSLKYLYEMFDCKTEEGVNTTLAYARYMAKVKLTPDNYVVFFKLISSGNHWIIDALLEKNDPEIFLTPVQPNKFMVSESFKILTERQPKEIYPKLLLIILGLLKVCFEDPLLGIKLYSITPNTINQIGKHLDPEGGFTLKSNQLILHILDRIASLNTPGKLPPATADIEKSAVQANNIRGKFLDPNKTLKESIPDIILAHKDYKESEIAPTEAKASKG